MDQISLNGQWTGVNGEIYTISQTNNNLIVTMPDGTNSNSGFVVLIGSNYVICVDFQIYGIITGVLSQDGKTIYWANNSIWTN